MKIPVKTTATEKSDALNDSEVELLKSFIIGHHAYRSAFRYPDEMDLDPLEMEEAFEAGIEKDYQAAYDLALDAIGRLYDAKNDEMSGLVAKLAVCIGATYAMARDGGEARRLIDFAQSIVLELYGASA